MHRLPNTDFRLPSPESTPAAAARQQPTQIFVVGPLSDAENLASDIPGPVDIRQIAREEIRKHRATHARKWLGTPFRTNGRAIGKAADCHNLTYALHRATGAFPAFEIPRGQCGIAGQLQVRRMSDFFAQKEFMQEVSGVKPGDIVTGKTIGGEYHMATFLGDLPEMPQAIIAAQFRLGVTLASLANDEVADQVVAIWRILEQ